MRSIILWHQLTIDGAHEPIYQCAAILQLFSSSDLKRRSWRCSKPANHQPPHRTTSGRRTWIDQPTREAPPCATPDASSQPSLF